MNFRPLKPGDLLAEGLDPRPQAVDLQTAVFVQRPAADVWVSPPKELGQIHGYVSEVLIPSLLTGGPTSPALPRQIRCEDTGETTEERINAGGHDTADKRLAEEVRRENMKAYEEPRRWIETEE